MHLSSEYEYRSVPGPLVTFCRITTTLICVLLSSRSGARKIYYLRRAGRQREEYADRETRACTACPWGFCNGDARARRHRDWRENSRSAAASNDGGAFSNGGNGADVCVARPAYSGSHLACTGG